MSATSESQALESNGSVDQAFRRAMVNALDAPGTPPNVVVELLTEHLGGVDPRILEATTDHYGVHLHVNLQVALDDFLAEPGRTHRLIGAHCPSHTGDAGDLSLSLILSHATLAWAPVELMPAQYKINQSGCEETMACLVQGLILFDDADGPGAIYVRGESGFIDAQIYFDVMHPSADRATEILTDLRERGARLSPYRGQVVEIGIEIHPWRPRQIKFLPRPDHTDADDVVLPDGLLDEIEEQSIEVLKARDALTASGRHLKRGLLLHGRPGTGKTHTIRYLISQMPEVTVVILSGSKLVDPIFYRGQPLERIGKMVEFIEPAVIIFDDVDFIAEDRSMPGMSKTRKELFSLLDLLDGIDDDADLMYVLTTNRPNTLEPAVAARPGRIDQAIEVPLPDAGCRRRLLELYTRRTQSELTEDEIESFVSRTAGVTASFVREAVRRAAVAYVLADGVDNEGPVVITGAGLTQALDDLLDPAKPLTALLLGAEPKHAQPVLAQITAPS